MWKIRQKIPVWSHARKLLNLNGHGRISAISVRYETTDTPAEVPYKKYEADKESLVDAVPSSADAVIVGGGVIGCSTLYYLSKLGMKNVVLLEKDQLTAGTTWHTAGLVWSLRPSDIDQQLLIRSRQLMKTLEEETGVHPGWINNGGLFVATNKERLDEYKRSATLGKAMGIESFVLGPSETKKLYPLMNVDDVYGTLYSPEDGTIDPAGYCAALSRAARHRGAKVIQDCPVSGIRVEKDDYGTPRVVAVETAKGHIKTNCVVNCAGAWAPAIGEMAGVKVPLIPWKHAYIVTERIEGIQNMPNCRDHDASLYLKLQGDSLCVGGYEPNPVFLDNDRVPPEFAFSLYELDWDVFTFNVESAFHRVPAIEQTGVKSTVCGPESFTADHKPLLGESPDVRGFYFGCGFNSMGMMMSGGVGHELACWIIKGKPELDMYGSDIRRFTTKLTDNKKWLKERSHESYAKTYSIVFAHDEPLACRNIRKDVLYEINKERGCVFQERQGWERPGWFSPDGPAPPLPYDYYGYYGNEKNDPNLYYDRLKCDYTFDFPTHHDVIKKECLSCRENAAVFNMSYFGKFYIVGPDAQKAVDWIFSNDLQKPAGSTVYTCMLNERGGVESDLTVSVIESGSGGPHAPKFEGSGFYVAIGGAVAQYGWSHIQDILQDKKFQAKLIDHSDDMCMLSLQGPKSRAILESVSDADFSNDAFPFSTNKIIQVAEHEVRALRLSFVGEMGWEIHVPNKTAVEVYEALLKAGESHGLVDSGYRAIDSLSIEKGYRHWHADIRSDDTPLEGGLGFTCKLKTDTPFLGRKAIEEQKSRGLFRRVACFTIDDHVPLNGLEAIYRDGTIVGYLRRGDYAFALDKSIGYGYVKHPEGKPVTIKWLKEGNYELERMGIKYKANYHSKSPFDPDNKRVKGIYDEPLPVHAQSS